MSSFKWTTGTQEYLRVLSLQGKCLRDIMSDMSVKFNHVFTYSDIQNARSRYGITSALLEEDDKIKLYTDIIQLPDDLYMITADYHSPYHSVEYVNRMLCIAEKMGIKKKIIVGDLFDMDFAKFWQSDEKSTLDNEVDSVSPVMKALSYFDEVTLVRGNHENRVSRMTDGRIQARHLYNLFGDEDWNKKFRYSVYDKLFIGDNWMLVHPKSYSQLSGSTAVRLTEKYHRHVINAHGHFMALRYDRSGTYMGIDVGGMFDRRKIEYINKKTTTHPVWNNGFVVVDGNTRHLFDKHTDWRYYGL